MNQKIAVVMFNVGICPFITELNRIDILEDVSSGNIMRFIDDMIIVHTDNGKFGGSNLADVWKSKNFYISSFYYGSPVSISCQEITQIEDYTGIKINR